MKSRDEPPARGLPAVEAGRKRRLGFPNIPPRFWLWVFTILAVWAIIYWKITQGQLESWRNRLLSQQRAVSSEIAPRFTPLRDQVESWVVESAGDYPGDLVAHEAITSDFRSKSGIYLRLYVEDAKTTDSIRASAMDSLRDGFTSCFTTHPNADPFAGPACKLTHECPQGQHCNEVLHCSVPAQPYNLRVAYRATRILYDDWATEVREAGNDMRLRLLERDFDSAVKDDIPLVVDLMVRAKYFLLVLDETASDPEKVPDAGTYCESVQAVEHPVRVFAWDLQTKKPLLRVRTSVTAQIGTLPANPTTRLAVRRQSNNCAIALDVRRRLGDESLKPPPDGDTPPAPATSSSASAP